MLRERVIKEALEEAIKNKQTKVSQYSVNVRLYEAEAKPLKDAIIRLNDEIEEIKAILNES